VTADSSSRLERVRRVRLDLAAAGLAAAGLAAAGLAAAGLAAAGLAAAGLAAAGLAAAGLAAAGLAATALMTTGLVGTSLMRFVGFPPSGVVGGRVAGRAVGVFTSLRWWAVRAGGAVPAADRAGDPGGACPHP